MATRQGIVIVGAGLAAAKAAETLRADGYTDRLVVLGDEPYRPYERPPLSKGYLLGTDERESLFVHPARWYADHDVELRTDALVTAIDRYAHQVVLAGGERVPYGTLLLSTGSDARHLDVPGADHPRVVTLRRIDDSDRLRALFADSGQVVVIGSGWIGLEVTAAARGAGLDVTLLERGELPLLRVLGPEVAPVYAELHRAHGVRLHTRAQVTEIVTAGDAVTGVRLADGVVIPADLVVVGIGARARTELALGAGIEVDDGIVVDTHLRTSDPDVFAAGDVAHAQHARLARHVRVEHWANAVRQGEQVARTMRGRDVVEDRSPYFYSDQYDVGMEYTGYVDPGATHHDGAPVQVVFRGDVPARAFVAFWLTKGRLLAGMSVNVPDVTDAIDAIVRSGRPVDVDRITDPDVPLSDLLDA